MKKLIIILIAALPLASFAGTGNKVKVNISISTDKHGKVQVSGMKGDLKQVQDEINNALKDVTVTVNDKKAKHEIHLKAEINID